MVGSLYSPKSGRIYTLTRHMLLPNWTSRMPLAQCIARHALTSWKSTSTRRNHGFLPPKTCGVGMLPFLTHLRRTYLKLRMEYPKRDPLSTLVFATAMSLLTTDIVRSKAPSVSMVAYVDDTVLSGPAGDVTQAITEIQTEATTGGLKLQKAKTQVWSPTQTSIDDEPLLRTLQGSMGDKRGILVLGETVSEEPEDAIPIGNEAFVTDHISIVKQKLLDDLCKLEHFPHELVKGEAGLQTAWGHCNARFPADSYTLFVAMLWMQRNFVMTPRTQSTRSSHNGQTKGG